MPSGCKYTVHQPMLFPPIYLCARWAQVDAVVWFGSDLCKPGYDGWHTKCKLYGKAGEVVIPAQLQDRKGKTIREVKFHDYDRWWGKLQKTLDQLYGKEKQFQAVMEIIDSSYTHSFGVYNLSFIAQVFDYLKLKTVMYDPPFDCPAKTPEQTASEWLAKCGTAINCMTYVCAEDATSKYLDVIPFQDREIQIETQKYIMPRYTDHHQDATASILDLLFRLPPRKAKDVLLA